MSLVKYSVWVLVAVLLVGQLQETLVSYGVLSKPIKWEDVCNIFPAWFKNVLGCKTEISVSRKQKSKPRLNLGGEMLEKFKFETREKTASEKLMDKINKLFVYAQRLVLPDKYVMPCILGDCNMDKEIKKQREEYSNLMHKTVPVFPPDTPMKDQDDTKKPDLPEPQSSKADDKKQ